MALSRRLRFEILRRDDHTCRYCGQAAPDVKLTVDHVIPVALGGSDDPSNLTAACVDCNAGKSATAPDQAHVEQVNDDALRWANAMRRAAAMQEEHASRNAEQVAAFDDAWQAWTYNDGSYVSRPPGWDATVRNWIDAGMDARTLADLINNVLPRKIDDANMWQYFCGAVRNVLNERQEIARRLLAGGVA